MKVLAFTRPMLDLHVRRRLSSDSRVKIMDNTDVLRLVPDGNKDRVAGVLICARHSESDRRVATELRADLVVDTTGRASRAPRWLNDLGYVVPEETVVDAHLGYASRLYRIPDDFTRDWKCAYVQSAPPQRNRGAILFEVEGNRWLVTLLGGGRDYPPSDEVGFLEFARSLPVSMIYDAMCAAEPITPIKTHRGTENRLRHFERAKKLPENFVLLGDAVCAFNPVYGQGMTIAALGALTLRNTLREEASLRGLSRRFQKRLGKVNKAPWLLATGEDYRYPETKGHGAGLMTKFMHRYMNQVLKLATQSVAVRRVLLRAFSMLVPPTALLHPRIAFRVLAHVLKERKAHENADRNYRRERQVGGRQKVSENRLVS
jgi:2-polyprenyl-6-methoxyphenol hydroxylase-like FAD-dependent oxidoreductase